MAGGRPGGAAGDAHFVLPVRGTVASTATGDRLALVSLDGCARAGCRAVLLDGEGALAGEAARRARDRARGAVRWLADLSADHPGRGALIALWEAFEASGHTGAVWVADAPARAVAEASDARPCGLHPDTLGVCWRRASLSSRQWAGGLSAPSLFAASVARAVEGAQRAAVLDDLLAFVTRWPASAGAVLAARTGPWRAEPGWRAPARPPTVAERLDRGAFARLLALECEPVRRAALRALGRGGGTGRSGRAVGGGERPR